MFDAITARASEICQTPIALISLVDKDRQWFKSRVGLDTAESHRNVAFCSHAILQNELMVVPDALNDHRFAENPLVRQAPSIRFYAGMPLIMSDGSALGTLCVIDQQPRELTRVQTDQLKVLAESARILLEVRTADGRESDLRFIFANDALYRITGYSEEDQSALQTMAESIQLRQTSVTETLNYTKAGTPFWTRLTLIPILNEECQKWFSWWGCNPISPPPGRWRPHVRSWLA